MYLILAPGTMCMATDQWKVCSFISFIHLLFLSLFSMSLMNHIRDLVESSHYKHLVNLKSASHVHLPNTPLSCSRISKNKVNLHTPLLCSSFLLYF